MPKDLSAALLAHYQGVCQTLTRCLRIARQDGVVIGLTEHDQDIVFEGVVYKSAAGYTPTVVQTRDQLAVGTVEIEGLLTPLGVEKTALRAGLFDHARIEFFEINYSDVGQGALPLLSGYWGTTAWQGDRYTTEFRSLADVLQQPFGELVSATCRAQLGDQRCKKNLESFNHSGVITAVVSDKQFMAAGMLQAPDYFQGGQLTWLSGDNKNQQMAIQAFQTGGLFQLLEAPPYPLQAETAFVAVAGCDKTLITCKTRFDNVMNFRGEPFLPGRDHIARYPDIVK
jgi:uncharacterized phage protein (TIGR02218 family)